MVRSQTRHCTGITRADGPCGADPMRDQAWCFWHHPDYVKEAAEARRLGGIRRKREGMVKGAYDFDGLRTVEDARRLLEIGATDALGLDNSIARVRAITSLALAALKAFEVGEFEERLLAIESVLEPRLPVRGTRR